MRPAMVSFVVIEADGADEAAMQLAMARAFDDVQAIDSLLHPTRAGSDLARAEWRQPGRDFEVAPLTHEVLLLAAQLHRYSGGVFDPCVPDLPGRFSDIELLPDFRVRCHVPVALDLGGIAKGYAVDIAIARLQPTCIDVLVNAGGDVRAIGKPVTIMLRHANGPEDGISLRNAALAVSEAIHEQRPAEHRGYYSRLATPTRIQHEYVAVKAAQAAVADALTKVVMMSNAQQAAAVLNHFNAELMFSR